MASPIHCPFCGNTDSEVVAAEFEGYKRRVECFSCGATGPLGETEDQAVELWNAPRYSAMRAPMPYATWRRGAKD